MPRKKKAEETKVSFKESIKKEMQTELKGGLTKVVNKEVILAPPVDIYDNKEDYLLVFLMPGLKNGNISIEIADNVLTVEEKRDKKKAAKPKNLILEEIEKRRYYRKFKLTNDIDEKKISALMEDGIVKVTLPKKKEK